MEKQTEKKTDNNATKNPEAMVNFYQSQYRKRIWAAKVRRQKRG